MKMLRPVFSVVICSLFAAAALALQSANHASEPQADLGVRVNAQIAALPATGGTVHISAGNYTYSTTIKLTRAGQHLVCDPGTVMRYTGSGDAILVDAPGGGVELDIDGSGGCELLGTPAAQNGIHLMPGNTYAIRGMRICEFRKGNAIELSGANNVQIVRNSLQRNQHGIDMVTLPHYAPNAVHVTNNEIADDDWAVYSRDAHVPATRALGNVYRDNVFEANHVGDLFLGWDAHTLVTGNYFESLGTGVAIGTGGGKVYDIHVDRNYFTVNGKSGYRSEVELGDAASVFIEGNYEEGPKGAGTDCAVNVVPGIRGGVSNVLLRNAFSRASEGAITAHEFCYEGSPKIPPGVLGESRLIGDVSVQGAVRAKSAQLSGPLELGQGSVASTDALIKPNDACSAEGMLLISRPGGQPARLFFCSGFRWRPVVMPGR